MARLFFVYAVLLALVVCASSGVLGATKHSVSVSKVSLETWEAKKDYSQEPVFGGYFYEASLFKGDFEGRLKTLAEFLQERKKRFEEFKLENKEELAKLREEHRSLMVSKTNLNEEELADPYSKWAVSLYSNIGRQALAKQSYQEKIANWDRKNFVEVKSIIKDGRRYLTEIQVKRVTKG